MLKVEGKEQEPANPQLLVGSAQECKGRQQARRGSRGEQ